jgi:hypothetical protein
MVDLQSAVAPTIQGRLPNREARRPHTISVMKLGPSALVAWVAASLLIVGCGDSDSRPSARTAPEARSQTIAKREPPANPRGSGRSTEFRREAETSFAQAAKEEAAREAERKREEQERAKDPQLDGESLEFEELSPFEAAVSRLPIRKPPLPIQQYTTFGKSHRVFASPSPRDFYCGRSPRVRLAAVRAFYTEARKVFRSANVRDFSLVVAMPIQRANDVRPLARASNGTVRLTRLGRARGPC